MQELENKSDVPTKTHTQSTANIQRSRDVQTDVQTNAVAQPQATIAQLQTTNPTDWQVACLGAVCFAVFLWNLGGVGLLDARESCFAEGAREMMVQREFLVPLLNYQTFCDSPILTYWLQILSYRVFGVSEFATRLPSAVMACVLTFATYWIGARLRNKNVGLMAALIVCTSPLLVAFGRLGSPDIISSALLSVSIYALFARLTGASRQALVVSYGCIGVAALASGPLPAVVFGATFLLAAIASSKSMREFSGQIAKLEIIPGALCAMVISLSWFIAAHVVTDGLWTTQYFSGMGAFLGNLDLTSVATNVAIAFGAMFPWIIFLPAALKTAVSEKRLSRSSADDRSWRYLSSWLAAVVVSCSLFVTISPAYALPFVPVMALMVAIQIDEWLDQARNDMLVARYYKFTSLALAAVGIACLFVSALFAIEFLFVDLAIMPELFGAAGDWFIARCPSWMKVSLVVGPLLLGAGLCLQCAQLLVGRMKASLISLFGAAVAMTVIALPIGFKIAYEAFDADLHRAIKVIVGKKDGQVAIFRDSMPSLSYYLGRPVETLLSPNQLQQSAAADSKVYVISRIDAVRPLVSGHTLRVLSKRGDWLVLEANGGALSSSK